MEYCAPHGIPHSTFLGWPKDDQDKAIAWLLDQSKRCHMCGTYFDIWYDEEGIDVFPPPMYPHSRRCGGCVSIAAEEERIKVGNEGDRPPGMTVYLSSEPPVVREDEEEFEDE